MQLFEYLARRLSLYGERQKNYAVLVYRVIDELRRSGVANKEIALDLVVAQVSTQGRSR